MITVTPAEGLLLGAGASALLAGLFAVGFVKTARWALALVAAGAGAAAIGINTRLLGIVAAGALATGLATCFSPAWWQIERLAAERNGHLLPEQHRRQLASASRWYPGRIAATTLVLLFPAVAVAVCFVVAHWSLARVG